MHKTNFSTYFKFLSAKTVTAREIPGWRMKERSAALKLQGRREIKYLPWTNSTHKRAIDKTHTENTTPGGRPVALENPSSKEAGPIDSGEGQLLLVNEKLKSSAKNPMVQLILHDRSFLNNTSRTRSNSLSALQLSTCRDAGTSKSVEDKNHAPITWQQDKVPMSKRKRNEASPYEWKEQKRVKAKVTQHAVPT